MSRLNKKLQPGVFAYLEGQNTYLEGVKFNLEGTWWAENHQVRSLTIESFSSKQTNLEG